MKLYFDAPPSLSDATRILCEDLGIPARDQPVLAIALGTPAETAVLEDADEITAPYYRDENNVHHVPKRKLEDVLL